MKLDTPNTRPHYSQSAATRCSGNYRRRHLVVCVRILVQYAGCLVGQTIAFCRLPSAENARIDDKQRSSVPPRILSILRDAARGRSPKTPLTDVRGSLTEPRPLGSGFYHRLLGG